MVNIKYNALYTDNLGCEKAVVYFSKKGLQLDIRGCSFENEYLDFDFVAKSSNEAKHLFYMKDNELIDYVLDIKIPLILTHSNTEYSEKFLLSVERHRNHYKNTLSFLSKDRNYSVKGYDLEELFFKMKRELPKGYNIKSYLLSIFNNKGENNKFDNIFQESVL
ncbi:DUF6304 family protein [Clostridium saccharobutylicum]|uniref:Uncharacterized protein n=1 Tax=Clostridium saccharobutylicum TaxID=169679 RepID=A0A1S8NBG9_CLOSA|nr:DUF6304 family protein [Clostridium saccharobutylicum]OOM13809.1 hypothetical protein CLOSAC_18950 [Clostridium saccharobutylicum]